MKLPTHSKLQEYKGLYSNLNKLFEIVSRDSGDILIRFNESKSENVEDISAVQGLLQRIQSELDNPELNKVNFNTPCNTQEGSRFDTIYFICNDVARKPREISYKTIKKYLEDKGIKPEYKITNGSTTENNYITIKKGNYEDFSLKHNIRIILKGGKKSSNGFITKNFLEGNGIIEEDKHWVLKKENIPTIKKTILNNVKKGVEDKKLTVECGYIIKDFLNRDVINNRNLKEELCKTDDKDYPISIQRKMTELMADNFTVFTYFSEVLIPWMILNKVKLIDANGNEVDLIPQTYRNKNRDLNSVREVAFPTDPSNKETDSVVRFDIDKPPVDADELEDNFRISSKANGGSGCSLFNIFTENFVVEEDCSLKELYEVYLKYKGRPNYQPISIYHIALRDMLNSKDFNNIKDYIPQIFKAFTLNDEKQIRLEIDKTIGSYKIYDIIKQAVTSDEARKKYSDIVNMDIFINQFPVSMTGFCCRYLAGKLNKDKKSMEIIKKEFTKDRFYQYHTGVSKTKGLEVDITEVNEENQRNIAAKVQTKETLTTNKIGHGALVTRFSQNGNE